MRTSIKTSAILPFRENGLLKSFQVFVALNPVITGNQIIHLQI